MSDRMVLQRCSCATWRENIDKVNAPLMQLFARNPATYRGYDGAAWRYCPWCGTELLPPVE